MPGRGAGHAPRGTTEGGGGKKLPATARFARAAGNFFPPAAFRGPPWRVPRAAPEHGRLPMDAAPRIASINFAIAFALLIQGNRGPLISITVVADAQARGVGADRAPASRRKARSSFGG